MGVFKKCVKKKSLKTVSSKIPYHIHLLPHISKFPPTLSIVLFTRFVRAPRTCSLPPWPPLTCCCWQSACPSRWPSSSPSPGSSGRSSASSSTTQRLSVSSAASSTSQDSVSRGIRQSLANKQTNKQTNTYFFSKQSYKQTDKAEEKRAMLKCQLCWDVYSDPDKVEEK